MIDILNESTAVVDDFSELKTVLEGTGDDYGRITTVYCRSNISQTAAPITVPLSKPEVVIDGTYENNRASYTTVNNSSVNYITTENPGTEKQTMAVTMQNMDITGNNFYGAMASPDQANYTNVTFTYNNVIYTGAQANFHRYGTVKYLDCIMNIDYHEVAECGRAIIGGNTRITHTMAGYSSFWMPHSTEDQYFKILPGANVTITAEYAALYIQAGAEFILEENAALVLNAKGGISYSTAAFSNFSIGESATLVCTQTAAPLDTVYIKGRLSIQSGTNVYFENVYTNTSVFNVSASSHIVIEQPDSLIMRSSSKRLFTFTGTSDLDLTGGQLNLWLTAPNAADPGGFADPPTYSWRKSTLPDQSVPAAYVRGSTTNTVFTPDADGTNLTEEELSGKTLSNLLLYNSYVFSMGALPLWVNPIADDGWPIFGKTFPQASLQVEYTVDTMVTKSGNSDGDGNFSIDTDSAVPLDTLIKVTANLPFLLSSVQMHTVPVGGITLVEAPEKMVFDIEKKASVSPLRIKRGEDGWCLIVSDSRARSTAWRLYVSIDGHMSSFSPQGDVKHTLPDALIFVNKEGEAITLSGQPTLVWEGRENDGDLTKQWSVKWADDKGILLTSCSNSFWSGERYTAGLSWHLEAD